MRLQAALAIAMFAHAAAAQESVPRLEPEQSRLDRAQPAPPPPVPLEGPLDPAHYVCGPGDVLELNFWGAQNFRLRATADLEGRAFFSRLGFLTVAGKTLADVRTASRKAQERYFPGLNVELSLIEPRAFLVHLVGAVTHPGVFRATQVERLSSVVERAGGFAPQASRRAIAVRRGGNVLRADLVAYQQTGDSAKNPFLLDGDVVDVPFEAVAVSIGGGVNRPGRYELEGTKDLVEALALAGGFSPTHAPSLPITLVRRDQSGRSITSALGADTAAPLSAGDEILVPTLAELQRTVTLVGAIEGAVSTDESTTLKRLPWAEGDTVRTLLLRAGAPLPSADLAHAALLHEDGGVEDVDLEALLLRHDLSADRKVASGDTLTIPPKRRNVVVEGAVFRPGAYPYNPHFTLPDYISAAGGPTRGARSLDAAHLITADGQTRALAPGLRVGPGDIVVMPERDFTRYEVVQLILSAAGILLSGTAIVIALHQ